MKPEIAETVINRAKGYCEVCGKPANDGMALHHRKLRSRGGKDEVANLLYIHHKCHNLGTNSVHLNPALSTERGYLVPSWAEPDEYPVARPDGTTVRLLNDGSVQRLNKEGI